MQAEDVDGDGNLDIMMTGNDFGTDVSIGRYDALKGLVLKGDGKGNFKPLSISESGFFTKGNCRGMINSPLVKFGRFVRIEFVVCNKKKIRHRKALNIL